MIKLPLIKLTFIYAAGNSINKIIPFLLLPILTHYISPEGYGKISIVQIIISFFTVLISLNFNGAYLRYYYKLACKDKKRLLFNVIFFTVVNFILLAAVSFFMILFGGVFLSDIFSIDSMWLYVAIVISFSNSIMALILVNFQINKSPIKYSLATISYSFVNIFFSLLLIIYLDYGWEGRIFGILISSILLLIIAFLNYKKERGIRIDSYDQNFRKKIYNFGFPLLPHALSGIILVGVDRVFLANMIGLSSTGVYAVAYQFGMIISIISSSINSAWAPFFFKEMENSKSSVFILIKGVGYIAIALFLIVIVLIFLSKLIILNYLNVEYHDSIKYITLIAWGYFFEGLCIMVSNFILFYNKNIYLSYSTITAVFLNIILNIILINSMGVYGAALATFISYVVSFIMIAAYTVFLIKVKGKIRSD